MMVVPVMVVVVLPGVLGSHDDGAVAAAGDGGVDGASGAGGASPAADGA